MAFCCFGMHGWPPAASSFARLTRRSSRPLLAQALRRVITRTGSGVGCALDMLRRSVARKELLCHFPRPTRDEEHEKAAAEDKKAEAFFTVLCDVRALKSPRPPASPPSFFAHSRPTELAD